MVGKSKRFLCKSSKKSSLLGHYIILGSLTACMHTQDASDEFRTGVDVTLASILQHRKLASATNQGVDYADTS